MHILTRHLSLFAILTGVVSDANAAPRDFAAVIADDGLTLRWAPGIPQVRNFVLYADGVAIAQFGGVQFETKLGQITADDTAPLHADRDQPARDRERPYAGAARGAAARRPVAGGRHAGARGTRLHRRLASCRSSAPGIPAGTVVGPTGVHVQEEGTPSTFRSPRRPPAARSPCGSRSPRAPTARAARSPLASRSPTARAST